MRSCGRGGIVTGAKRTLAAPSGCRRSGEPPSEEGSSQQRGQESHHYIHSVHKLLLSASEYLNERFHIAVKEFMIID